MIVLSQNYIINEIIHQIDPISNSNVIINPSINHGKNRRGHLFFTYFDLTRPRKHRIFFVIFIYPST